MEFWENVLRKVKGIIDRPVVEVLSSTQRESDGCGYSDLLPTEIRRQSRPLRRNIIDFVWDSKTAIVMTTRITMGITILKHILELINMVMHSHIYIALAAFSSY